MTDSGSGRRDALDGLIERFEGQINEWETWDSDPTQAYERLAAEFYHDTGLIAPGKSVPLEMASVQNDDERRQRYTEWGRARVKVRHAMLREVLAALRPGSPALATPNLADAAEMLWIVLANVSGGDWTQQTQEWQDAAARWRDNYLRSTGRLSPVLAEAPQQDGGCLSYLTVSGQANKTPACPTHGTMILDNEDEHGQAWRCPTQVSLKCSDAKGHKWTLQVGAGEPRDGTLCDCGEVQFKAADAPAPQQENNNETILAGSTSGCDGHGDPDRSNPVVVRAVTEPAALSEQPKEPK